MDALALVAVGFVGTFFWVISPEAAVVVFASQRGWPAPVIGLLAATGQAAAHLVLFTTGDQLRRRWRWFEAKCERARARHGRWLEKGVVPLGCLSGLVGIPPSSVTAALAPGLGLRAGALLPLLFAMRIVRLTTIAVLAARLGPAALGMPH
jgi:hypothetical protein